jgi:hypothetical protein
VPSVNTSSSLIPAPSARFVWLALLLLLLSLSLFGYSLQLRRQDWEEARVSNPTVAALPVPASWTL